MIWTLIKVFHVLMKLAGLRPLNVEVDPGTILHFWVNKTNSGQDKHMPPSKHVVALIHGFAEDGVITWIPQVLALYRKYAVYVPDLLFFGGSTSVNNNRTVEFQAQCMMKALEKLGVARCTLVGFSYGGFVSIKIAESQPELVQGLVLCNSIPVLSVATSSGILQRLRIKSWSEVLLPTTVQETKTSFRIVCNRRPPIPRCLYEQYLKTMFNNRKEKAELLQAAIIKDADYKIPKISVETDKIFSPRDIEKSIKMDLEDKAEVHYIKKGGHYAQLERPCAYNKTLKKILAALHQDGSDCWETWLRSHPDRSGIIMKLFRNF